MVDTLPIAETQHTIQGEGEHAGRPMHFIRLAGCSVGEAQPTSTAGEGVGDPFPILSTGRTAFRCHTWDGRPFWCDTDFRKNTDISVDALVSDTWENRICLTGGEPLMHQQKLIQLGFFAKFWERNVAIHVETSGTVMLHPSLQFEARLWVTVAPKQGCLPEMLENACEVKFLVDEHFDPSQLPERVLRHRNVFLSPINGEKEINERNMELTRGWLRKFPHWRLNVQVHKYLRIP